MANYAIKCRTKSKHDGVPAGVEFQVLTNNKSFPSGTEVAEGLKKAGFPNVHTANWGTRSYYEIL